MIAVHRYRFIQYWLRFTTDYCNEIAGYNFFLALQWHDVSAMFTVSVSAVGESNTYDVNEVEFSAPE